MWLRAAPVRSAATRIGSCSRERPRLRALPPRRRGLPVQLPLALPALKHEGLVGLDDPGKPDRRLPDRLQEAVAPAMRRARRNPAARGRRAYRLPFGQRLAERQPALLVVQIRRQPSVRPVLRAEYGGGDPHHRSPGLWDSGPRHHHVPEDGASVSASIYPVTSAILLAIRLAAALRGSLARWAYRAVVCTLLWPSSFPIIGNPSPTSRPPLAKECRRS